MGQAGLSAGGIASLLFFVAVNILVAALLAVSAVYDGVRPIYPVGLLLSVANGAITAALLGGTSTPGRRFGAWAAGMVAGSALAVATSVPLYTASSVPDGLGLNILVIAGALSPTLVVAGTIAAGRVVIDPRAARRIGVLLPAAIAGGIVMVVLITLLQISSFAVIGPGFPSWLAPATSAAAIGVAVLAPAAPRGARVHAAFTGTLSGFLVALILFQVATPPDGTIGLVLALAWIAAGPVVAMVAAWRSLARAGIDGAARPGARSTP